MGYTITIGDVQPGELICEDGEYRIPMEIEVLTHERDGPRDGSPTDGTNQRWPDYSGWEEFTQTVGLYDMFYNEDTGIMRNHPGVFELTEEHQMAISRAEGRLKKLPQAVRELHGGRLMWLSYWVEFAVKHCKRPAIKNT